MAASGTVWLSPNHRTKVEQRLVLKLLPTRLQMLLLLQMLRERLARGMDVARYVIFISLILDADKLVQGTRAPRAFMLLEPEFVEHS